MRPTSIIAVSVLISVIASALITGGITFAFERINAERVQSAQATLADIQTRGAALEASLKGLKTSDIVEVQTTLKALTKGMAELQGKMQAGSTTTSATSTSR